MTTRRALILVTLILSSSCSDRPDPERQASAVLAHNTGIGLLRRDRLREAEAEFKKVVELAPRDPVGHYNLGLTYLRGGKLEEAEEHLERARKLSDGTDDIALALARLYSLTGRADEARKLLEQRAGGSGDDARILYALAELESTRANGGTSPRRRELLERVLAREPANIAVRLDLIGLAVRAGNADTAIAQLEQLRRLPPEPPAEARGHLDSTLRALRAGNLDRARGAFDRLLGIMTVTTPYQASLAEVKWVEGPLIGQPIITFEPQSLVGMLGTGFRPPVEESARFVDVTSEAGLPEGGGKAPLPDDPAALASGDVHGDGSDDLFVGRRLFAIQRGFAADIGRQSGLSLGQPARLAELADVDNDGHLDLFLVTAGGDARILRNTGGGKLEDVTARAGRIDAGGARDAAWADLDHDGDLDLILVGRGPIRVHRNNLDGTFTETAARIGLGGGAGGDARSVSFADFDADGRLDLFVTWADRSDALYRNTGHAGFADVTQESGLATAGGSGAAAAGDYDNDGRIDLVISRAGNGDPALWRNAGDGTFARDTRSAAALRSLRGLTGRAAAFTDVDNDGFLDLVIAGTGGAGGRGAFLLHNDGTGRFTDRSDRIPSSVRAVAALAAADFDDDGDQDLVLAAPGGESVHLLRNEGGNARMASRLQLNALRTGSGKNNSYGIGARVELRAGELYQTRTVTGRVSHFGLGPHLKADVVRIEWPNGVPQTVYLPGTDQDVIELEHLKGSCAFVYAWDGTRFRFVTDAMWRSALGMPVGIMGGGGRAYASPDASEEFLRIPGDVLKPRDGKYLLQLTEELWETAYVDQVQLLAVDHPDSVLVFVDEKFVPPAPTTLRLFPVVRPQPPSSAVDGRGRNILPQLGEADFRYVDDLTPLDYQGVVEEHAIVLQLDPAAGGPGSHLFLRGWIYPTDASINVALAQRSDLSVAPPSLEVRDAGGAWKTVRPDIGFPSGKDKTIIVDLAGIFPTGDRQVRIRTSMQVYWDHAFTATAVAGSTVKVDTLRSLMADLHWRGFSRELRRGGRYGPHWFDYADVRQESPWRPIAGAFTRYGDVAPLLEAPDDRFIVMAPGDETTVAFDAAGAAPVPEGWTRTFILYTVGWIKDADMNTAFGDTVEPLPFHGIREYPYADGESYPRDSARLQYQREYNTRVVRRHGGSATDR